MIDIKLNAKELRDVNENEVKDKLKALKRKPFYFVLENIYDTYNIGGLFRLADGLAIEKIYLCGEMEIPPNSRIKKASIGTYKVVPWEYKKTARQAIQEIKAAKPETTVLAIEQDKRSIPYTQADYSAPVAFILGNETTGVANETLDLADQIVEIPMWGINSSLNVIVSGAIVAYWAANKL